MGVRASQDAPSEIIPTLAARGHGAYGGPVNPGNSPADERSAPIRRWVPLCLVAAACHGAAPSRCDDVSGDPAAGDQRNVLVILTDDIGIDQTGVYEERDTPGHTPHIDALAAEGIRFDNAWATPTCSSSRAALLTGQYPMRTGVGHWIYPETDEGQLELDSVTVPEVLATGPYAYTSAAVGKWHLGTFTRASPATHPLDQGFDCHAGSLGNPLDALGSGHTPRGYTRWEKAVDGEVGWSTRYMTTDTTDEALARIARLPSPWFLWVAYNGAHSPLHGPPASLRTAKVTAASSDKELYDAMVESVDTEIGRLLDGLGDRKADTTIVYLSDNGTSSAGREADAAGGGKDTMSEAGINVPMIVTGPFVGVPGSVSDALVNAVDLLPTAAAIAEVDLAAVPDARGAPLVLDGVSLLPNLADPGAPSPREYLYTESFWPNGAGPYEYVDRAVRDAGWKLIREESGGAVEEKLFRMEPGAWDEGADLRTGTLDAEAEAALTRLRDAMTELSPPVP